MSVTQTLAGRQIKHAISNGNVLKLVCDNGFEIDIAWLDDSGKPVKGMPHVVNAGRRILAPMPQSVYTG